MIGCAIAGPYSEIPEFIRFLNASVVRGRR